MPLGIATGVTASHSFVIHKKSRSSRITHIMHNMLKAISLAGGIAALLFITVLCLKFLPAPYVWIGLAWLLGFIVFSVFLKNSTFRLIGVYGSIAIATLTGYEAYLFWLSKGPAKPSLYRFEGTFPRGVYESNDAFLGYRLQKNHQATAIKYYDDELVYDVTYTVNDQGLRITPTTQSEIAGSVLFFGGSFTFGEGVNDDETLPYQLGKLSDGRYYVYNFGVAGYGPHQMLSALEHDIVARIVMDDSSPKIAIYQAIPDHIQRAAGLVVWDKDGPRYALDSGGNASFAGNFDDGRIPGQLANQLNKSLIYKKIFERPRGVKDGDVALFVGIVKRAKELLQEEYKSEFHIIFWDDPRNDIVENALSRLDDLNIPVHLITEILPDYAQDSSRYKIANDGHPKAETHQKVAQYILTHILDTSPTPGLLDKFH
jgi:hypothetical protein